MLLVDSTSTTNLFVDGIGNSLTKKKNENLIINVVQ